MKKQPNFITSRFERTSVGLYAFGTILSYYMIMSYLQLYMTDIGISAVAVGLIFIFAKIWDAVNDPIFGVLVDKVNLKGGKYRPWLRISSIAIPVTTVLLFIVPAQASVQAKIIWSSVAYVLWDTAYTMCDVPMNAIVTAMTESTFERNKMFALNAFFVYLGGILVAVAVPSLYPSIGWGTTAIILAVLATVAMLPVGFKAKERFVPQKEEEASIKDIILSLLKNKYLLIYTLSAIVGSLTDFSGTLNAYVAIHCLGDQSYITLLSLASAVPVLFVVLFVPRLLEKVEKYTAYLVTRIATIAISIIIWLVGYQNVGLLMALIVLKTLFGSVWGIMAVMFIADCVEYGQYTTGERNQGIAFATKAFTNKIIVALTGALGMFGLAAYGFVEGEGVVQTAETVRGIWNLYGLGPIVGAVLSLVILVVGYKLRDADVKTMIACNAGEISREEAESRFTRKF